MARQYYQEHRAALLQPVVFVDPRCKTALTYSRAPSVEQCFTCSNDEPGIGYIRLDMVATVVLDALKARDLPESVLIGLKTVILDATHRYVEHRRAVQGSNRELNTEGCVRITEPSGSWEALPHAG